MTRVCKDCAAEGLPLTRPATKPGPRCATHSRVFKKAAGQRAHGKAVEAKYGITAGQYADLYAFQGRVCALCLVANGKTKRLAVDHDHATGKVRGLLCGPCNQMLGQARDQIAFFERAADYLRQPPFERMNNVE